MVGKLFANPQSHKDLDVFRLVKFNSVVLVIKEGYIYTIEFGKDV